MLPVNQRTMPSLRSAKPPAAPAEAAPAQPGAIDQTATPTMPPEAAPVAAEPAPAATLAPAAASEVAPTVVAPEPPPTAAPEAPPVAMTQTVRRYNGVDYPVEVIDPTPVDHMGEPHIRVRGQGGSEGYVPASELHEVPAGPEGPQEAAPGVAEPPDVDEPVSAS